MALEIEPSDQYTRDLFRSALGASKPPDAVDLELVPGLDLIGKLNEQDERREFKRGGVGMDSARGGLAM